MDGNRIKLLEQEFNKYSFDLYGDVLDVEKLYDLAFLFEISGIDSKKYCNFNMLTKQPDIIFARLKFFKENNFDITKDSNLKYLGFSREKFFERIKDFIDPSNSASLPHFKSGRDFQNYLRSKYPMPKTSREIIEELEDSRERE